MALAQGLSGWPRFHVSRQIAPCDNAAQAPFVSNEHPKSPGRTTVRHPARPPARSIGFTMRSEMNRILEGFERCARLTRRVAGAQWIGRHRSGNRHPTGQGLEPPRIGARQVDGGAVFPPDGLWSA
jgi:hypothetical protein